MSNPIPTPTVGRIVLVPIQTSRLRPEGRVPGPIVIRPAIIVHVFYSPEGCMPLINVRVFTDGTDGTNDGLGTFTSAEWATSLRYSQDDYRPGTWHWMPYQIQTVGQRHPDTPKPVTSKQGGFLVTTFGEAIEALKAGMKVARSGWNGKGMWLVLQVPDAHSKMTLPYVYIEYPAGHPAYPNGSRVPWLASQTDMLAEDWTLVA